MIISNYVKVALRNMRRQSTHSIINIVGLSVGLTATLLIGLFVLNELNHDQFHEKKDRLYLLGMTWHFGGTDLPTGNNCTAGGPFMKETFPQVEEFVRFSSVSTSFRKNNEVIEEPNGLYADSATFRVFTFNLILGNPEHALTAPNSIVLTRSLAEKYFGSAWREKILDQDLTSSTGKVFHVSAVCEDVPNNSHIKFDYLISFSTLKNAGEYSWDNSAYPTYLLLHPNSNAADMMAAVPKEMNKRFGEGTSKTVELNIVPFQDVYLNNPTYKLPNLSDIIYVKVFSAIALMVLIIALVNYINLATSRAMHRGLEVGVRKVMGALRRQLFVQFVTESFIITFLAVCLAFGFSKVLLSLFIPLTGKSLDLAPLLTTSSIVYLALGSLIIGFVAGAYPALILTNYQPVKVLKGQLKDSVGGVRLRKFLVVFQFSVSVTLIVCTLTVSSQLNFVRNKQLGYDRNKIISINLDNASRANIATLRNSLQNETAIKGVSSATQLPVSITYETKIREVNEPEEASRLIKVWGTDYNSINTVGLNLIAGRNFDAQMAGTETQVILNESALKFFGWSAEHAMGKKLFFWGNPSTVIGVARDFHYASMHLQISPLVIFCGPGDYQNFLLVNTTAAPTEAQQILMQSWKKINSSSPFVMNFLDDRYNNLYLEEQRMEKLVWVFAGLAILISGLGLFGLASYQIVQRTKELGIRKVLGASVATLISMVSIDFIKPILISFFIAAPVSYYVMRQWLGSFAYRIEFSWLLVGEAGLVAMVVAALTVSYHSMQVASNNPVDSLRNE